MNKLINELEKFVGDWNFESVQNGRVVAGGKSSFEWFENKGFLIQRATANPASPGTPKIWIENSPFPIVVIISLDDPSGELYYNYSDGRGVHRVYRMSFKGGVWKVWGQAGPGFYQRFKLTFSDSGNTMAVHIEQSKDQKNWQTDFNTIYKRVNS